MDLHYETQNKCYLNHETDWQLLFATILSSQCTDDRVNIVTKDLFVKYKSLEDFATASLDELMKDVHSTGFYRNKAKNIQASAQMLLSDFNGQVPSNINDLTLLPGVGRKTANVIRSHIFNIPSIVVDTHVKRISNRFGIVENETPEKIEFKLMEILPKEHWIRYNTQVIAHGRQICMARSPKCNFCFFREVCSFYAKNIKD